MRRISAMRARQRVVAMGLALALGTMALPTRADFLPTAPFVGSNLDIDFNVEIDVPFSGFAGLWFVNQPIVHVPEAGPMIKRFESPMTDTLDRIILDGQEPFPIAVRETFELLPSPLLRPSTPFDNVYGWYQEVETDGWEWVTPSDPRYPDYGLFGRPLITKNGNPHPSRPAIGPAFSLDAPLVFRPDIVNVEFARLEPGDTLGVNKALVWVGTEGNRLWGDDQLDDGTPFDESVLRVWEYPTNLGALTVMPGDVNGDGWVGQRDLDLVVMNWGRDTDAVGLPPHWFSDPATGVIDQDDLNRVLLNWGEGSVVPPILNTAVPEPGTAFAVMGLLWLSGVRLRQRPMADPERT
ncbi:MAG: hypothetical protein AAF333_14970 [Planctomycetota bacterium]